MLEIITAKQVSVSIVTGDSLLLLYSQSRSSAYTFALRTKFLFNLKFLTNSRRYIGVT